jgi:hypothetical protein
MPSWAAFLLLSVVGTVGSIVALREFIEVMSGHADESIPEDAGRWRWTRQLLFPYGLLVIVFSLAGAVGDIGLLIYLAHL